MCHSRICRWGIEAGLVGVAGVDGGLHFVVDGEDGVFGDVGAVFRGVFAFDDG